MTNKIVIIILSYITKICTLLLTIQLLLFIFNPSQNRLKENIKNQKNINEQKANILAYERIGSDGTKIQVISDNAYNKPGKALLNDVIIKITKNDNNPLIINAYKGVLDKKTKVFSLNNNVKTNIQNYNIQSNEMNVSLDKYRIWNNKEISITRGLDIITAKSVNSSKKNIFIFKGPIEAFIHTK